MTTMKLTHYTCPGQSKRLLRVYSAPWCLGCTRTTPFLDELVERGELVVVRQEEVERGLLNGAIPYFEVVDLTTGKVAGSIQTNERASLEVFLSLDFMPVPF